MLFYLFNGRNAARTCRHFGISRQTFYRWLRRFDRHDLMTLEGRSHRPRHLRQPTWTAALAERVLALRKQYPCWGKVYERLLAMADTQSQYGRMRPILDELIKLANAQGKVAESEPYHKRLVVLMDQIGDTKNGIAEKMTYAAVLRKLNRGNEADQMEWQADGMRRYSR